MSNKNNIVRFACIAAFFLCGAFSLSSAQGKAQQPMPKENKSDAPQHDMKQGNKVGGIEQPKKEPVKNPAKKKKETIKSLKADGIIGEMPDGYIGFIKCETPKRRELIKAENKKRKEKYSRVAKKKKASVDEIARRNGKKKVDKEKKGHWTKDAKGEWHQK